MVPKKLTDAHPALKNLLSDIAAQPPWRGEAAIDMAWRDNRQWSQEQIEYLTSLGINPIHINLIAPAIEAVTGYEAKHRVDWMVSAASEEHEEMAEGVNHELNDEMRLARANHACSEAYESQACVGIGWVYVGRNRDPLDPSKIVIHDVHRDEMWWDMRARSEDLRKDCRWLARRRFFDKDSAVAFLGPRYKELVEFTCSDWLTIDISEDGPYSSWYAGMSEYTEPIELVLDNTSDRKMVAIYEVYYKVMDRRDLVVANNGLVNIFNKQNPVHLELLATGMAYLQTGVPVNVVRQAWLLGPHLIWDGPSPHPHNHFPYVPFFGPREDALNVPHGLIRRMRGPQEEYNRAAVEIQRILRQRRIEKDHDALHEMSDEQAIHEINRSDGVINKRHGREFAVIREWEKIAALENICTRAREEINAASGVYQTFQGQTEADQSGIAVESIAELGAQSLGKINSNYQLARKLVGDLAFYHVVESIGVQKKIITVPQEIGQQKRTVVLNDGPSNRLPMLRAQVALQDIHTSAGYKQHTHQRLTNVMERIPDEYKGVLLPFWLESSEMPKKEQAIKMINKMLGYEEDEQRRQEKEAIEAQQAEELRQLEMRKLVAEVDEMEAGAKDKRAQATNHMAEALKKRIETAKLIREFKLMGQVGGPGLPAQNMEGLPPDQRKALPPGASGETKPPGGDAAASPHPGSGLKTLPRETTP